MSLIVGFLPSSYREYVQLLGRIGRGSDKVGECYFITDGDLTLKNHLERMRDEERVGKKQILDKVRFIFKIDDDLRN